MLELSFKPQSQNFYFSFLGVMQVITHNGIKEVKTDSNDDKVFVSFIGVQNDVFKRVYDRAMLAELLSDRRKDANVIELLMRKMAVRLLFNELRSDGLFTIPKFAEGYRINPNSILTK